MPLKPRPLTGHQIFMLRHVAGGDDPSTYEVGKMTTPAALAFHARERVIDGLVKRGLLEQGEDGWRVTEDGLRAISEKED